MNIYRTEYRATIDGFGHTKAWHVDVLVNGPLSDKPYFVNVALGPAHDQSERAMLDTRKTAKQFAHVVLIDGLTFA